MIIFPFLFFLLPVSAISSGTLNRTLIFHNNSFRFLIVTFPSLSEETVWHLQNKKITHTRKQTIPAGTVQLEQLTGGLDDLLLGGEPRPDVRVLLLVPEQGQAHLYLLTLTGRVTVKGAEELTLGFLQGFSLAIHLIIVKTGENYYIYQYKESLLKYMSLD